MKKAVYVKDILLGEKITIQSMTNTQTHDIDSTKKQIFALKNAGADLVRISIPDIESAHAVKELIKCDIPLIGDIHFSEKPALVAIENGINKIRLNPSNMSKNGIKEVVNLCIQKNVPIRVGVNKGSVGNVSPQKLAQLCVDTAHLIEDLGWDKLVLAVKSSDVVETVQAYRELNKITNYPLHVGLTEAGTKKSGELKSAIAIGSLLLDGIGDTIRVSLSCDPVEEIYAAKRILRAVNLDKNFVQVISCPTCARTQLDIASLAERVEKYTENMETPLKIAIMGCVVNGIGEAKDADFGIAGGKEISALFKDKQIIKHIPNDNVYQEIIKLIDDYKFKNN